MIISLLSAAISAKEFAYCGVEVQNDHPIERGFISSQLSGEINRIFLETGWKYDCERGKPVKVLVKEVSYEGSSISGNRFSGYTFRISFDLILPERRLSYNLSKYVALPDPSLGTLPVRSAFMDLISSYSLRIKTDLLDYMRKDN